ncbi:MAG: T9SS type A sorting domain-containing protein [Saprospiraceae bacterium]|nr:T9SS type A sorting domain-containing protein [Saprospiraceae bacterium]
MNSAIALLYSLPCAKIDSLAFENPVEAARLMREAILQNTAPVSSLADETVSGGRLDVYEAMKYLHAYCIATQPELEGGDFKEKYLGGKGLVSVRPNPVTDELFVDYSHLDFKPVRLRMYNALGQEMILEENTFPAAFEAQTIKLDVSYLSSGFYVVNLFDLSRKISFKFIKI